MSFGYKPFYRRKLPHIHPPGATFFVTFRLAGSIPKVVLEQWKSEKQWLDHEIKRVSRGLGAISGIPRSLVELRTTSCQLVADARRHTARTTYHT